MYMQSYYDTVFLNRVCSIGMELSISETTPLIAQHLLEPAKDRQGQSHLTEVRAAATLFQTKSFDLILLSAGVMSIAESLFARSYQTIFVLLAQNQHAGSISPSEEEASYDNPDTKLSTFLAWHSISTTLFGRSLKRPPFNVLLSWSVFSLGAISLIVWTVVWDYVCGKEHWPM